MWKNRDIENVCKIEAHNKLFEYLEIALVLNKARTDLKVAFSLPNAHWIIAREI